MKRKHFITLLDGDRLSIYDAHCDPITWVGIDEFRREEKLSASQSRKLNNLIDGTELEIVLVLPEITY